MAAVGRCGRVVSGSARCGREAERAVETTGDGTGTAPEGNPAKILGLSGPDSSTAPPRPASPSTIHRLDPLFISARSQAKQSAVRCSLIPRSRIAPLHNGQWHRQSIHTAAAPISTHHHRHLGRATNLDVGLVDASRHGKRDKHSRERQGEMERGRERGTTMFDNPIA